MVKVGRALVLIDFENEWIDPKSDYYVGDISDVVGRVNRLIGWARKNGVRVIFTAHEEKGSKGAFAPGTKRTEIIGEIDREESDNVVVKNKISPFYGTEMDKLLEGIEEVVVAGILTNLCVRHFVEDAYDREFDVKIISDCCVAFDKETHEFTLKDLKNTREEIMIMELSEFLEGG